MSDTVTLHFTDAAERDRFNALRAEHPKIDAFLWWGVDQANAVAVPRILNGSYGITDRDISAAISHHLKVARKILRDEPPKQRPSRDDINAFCLGFRSVAIEAKRTALAAAKAGEAVQALAESLQIMSQSPAMAERLSAGLPRPGAGPVSPSPAPTAPASGRAAGAAAGIETVDRLWQETTNGVAPIEGLTDRILAAEKRGAARLRPFGPAFVAEWKAGFMSTIQARLDEHFAARRAANPLPQRAADQPPADTAG